MKRISRRQFVRAGVAGIALPYLIPASVLGADAPSKKITIGFIGTGAAPGPWIETGWATTAQPSDVTLATQRGDTDPNIGTGEWSTAEGKDYSDLLAFLGCVPGTLSTAPHGTNPWNSVVVRIGVP